jgi:hypothetical protein
MVNLDDLKNLYDSNPFQAFEILLEDGRRIVIERPEWVGWSAEAHTIAFPGGHDVIDWTDFSKVAAIRVLANPRSRQRKGME